MGKHVCICQLNLILAIHLLSWDSCLQSRDSHPLSLNYPHISSYRILFPGGGVSLNTSGYAKIGRAVLEMTIEVYTQVQIIVNESHMYIPYRLEELMLLAIHTHTHKQTNTHTEFCLLYHFCPPPLSLG